MNLVLPISACFDASDSFWHGLTILPQAAKLEKRSELLSTDNLQTFKEKLSPKHIMRLLPISPEIFDEAVRNETESGDIVVLHAEANFDGTNYNFLAQSALYGGGQIHTKALNGYGHALTYLSCAAARFYQKHSPSLDQLNLFIDQLNALTHTYLLGKRSVMLERETSALTIGLHRIAATKTLYASHKDEWQHCPLTQIRKDVADEISKGILIWIDSCRGVSYTRYLIQQFKEWGLQDQHYLRCNHLNHVIGTKLPERFALVTITPDEKQLTKIEEWALKIV